VGSLPLASVVRGILRFVFFPNAQLPHPSLLFLSERSDAASIANFSFPTLRCRIHR
jgi:hypothetical protein